MILKLAKNGMKGKTKDYLILFAGLMVSVAVFYMFSTLATNKKFITDNAVINSIQLVFVVGSVLLSFVTFFYVLYAHSFLLSLRKKEFGTYLLLGVKRKQIKKIAIIETTVVAISSIFIGILVGIFLSFLVSKGMSKQLGENFEGFQSFYLPAAFLTILYFTLTFFIISWWNNRKIKKTPILDFIYADVRSDEIPVKKKRTAIFLVLGIILLIIGYISLIFMEQLREIGLFSATITTTIGTYFLFSSLFPMLVEKMKKSKTFYLKDVNTFTFSQLHFRMNELKRLLATVAMLIALSAGAISGGFAFLNNVSLLTEDFEYYDVAVYNSTKEEEDILKSISFKEEKRYHFKVDSDHLYFSIDELVKNPPIIKDEITYEMRPAKGLTLDADFPLNEWGEQSLPSEWYTALYVISPHVFRHYELVPQEKYDQLNLTNQTIFIGKTESFLDYKEQWKEIDEVQKVKYEAFGEDQYMFDSKYATYLDHYGMSSGVFFMGFFLGIAFLTMMASTLMFKVLSSAHKDIHRYEMLRKIGVRREKLASSLTKELGMIFVFPAILGLLHVLIGMNLFSFIMVDPYYKLWISIVIFLVIYLIYFFITVYMYRKIVLPKK